MGRVRGVTVLLVLFLLPTVGCTTQFPADPDGTLSQVTGGTLRVGASVNAPYVESDGKQVTGSEVQLVQGYAADRDADVEWTVSSEEELMGRLDHGELDLVIGGLTSNTPWTGKAGLTLPYAESEDSFGSRRQHVLAVPLGENAFLLDLDTYLQARKAPAP